jgi:hypothetical protein
MCFEEGYVGILKSLGGQKISCGHQVGQHWLNG